MRWAAARCVFVVLVLFACSNSSVAGADDRTHRAVVLLIDTSGSLTRTDPGDLRLEAARLFLDTAPDGEKILAYGFDGATASLTHGWMDVSPLTRDAIRKALSAAGRSGAYTDHVAALEAAADAFEAQPPEFRSHYRPTVVLFTDGLLDPDPATGTRQARARVLGTVLDRLVRAGAEIHTVALGQSPAEILERASAATGGQAVSVTEPQGLLRTFWTLRERLSSSFKILDVRSARGTVPLEVPAWADAMSVVVLRATPPSAASVLGGSGDAACARFTGKMFDVYRCPRPAPGVWPIAIGSTTGDLLVNATGELRAHLEFDPAELVADEPSVIRVSVRAGSSVLTGYPFLSSAFVTATIGGRAVALHDDGASGDARAGDGVHSRTVRISSAGAVPTRWVISGESFRLSGERTETVLQSALTVAMRSPEVACFTTSGCAVEVDLTNRLTTRPIRATAAGDWSFEPVLLAPGETKVIRAGFPRPAQRAAEATAGITLAGFERGASNIVVVRRLTLGEWLLRYWWGFFPSAGLALAGVVFAARPAPRLRGRMHVSLVDGSSERYLATVDLAGLRARSISGSQILRHGLTPGKAFALRSLRRGLGAATELVPDEGSDISLTFGSSEARVRASRTVRLGDAFTVVGDEGQRFRFKLC